MFSPTVPIDEKVVIAPMYDTREDNFIALATLLNCYLMASLIGRQLLTAHNLSLTYETVMRRLCKSSLVSGHLSVYSTTGDISSRNVTCKSASHLDMTNGGRGGLFFPWMIVCDNQMT